MASLLYGKKDVALNSGFGFGFLFCLYAGLFLFFDFGVEGRRGRIVMHG